MKSDEPRPKRWKSVFSIFVIIFLGAIGSGVWDLFLKDVLYFLGTFFVNVMSSLYSGYIDTLYEDVGKKSNLLIYLPSAFVLAVIITAPFYFYVRIRALLRKIKSRSGTGRHQSKVRRSVYYCAIKRPNVFTILVMLPFLINSILYTNIFIVSSNNLTATKGMERWLDIIRPHIAEREYYQIVSDFRLIDSANDYQLLVTKVEDYAEEAPITLPPLAVYGVKTKTVESQDGMPISANE